MSERICGICQETCDHSQAIKADREMLAGLVQGLEGRSFVSYGNGTRSIYFGKDEPFLLRSDVLALLDNLHTEKELR